jgi:hypothetical protein
LPAIESEDVTLPPPEGSEEPALALLQLSQRNITAGFHINRNGM